MYIVILFSVLSLLLTYLESRYKIKNGMKFGFILVTFLGVIHYDYGNDYMSYLNIYKDVTNYSFNLNDIIAGEYFRDPGWVLLCWFFKPIGGFFMMVAVLNIIQNYIVYHFIKNHVDLKWWPIAIIIYLFSTSYYLMSFSMMRQEFVVILFLGMWDLIRHRKWLLPLVILYLCSFIHSSALVLIPFVFWGFLPIKNGKLLGVGYAILLLSLWFFQDLLNSIFQFTLTMDDDFSNYAETYSDNDKGIHLGIGFIINLIPFILSILFLYKQDNASLHEKQLVALSTISFLLIPFGQIIQSTGRLSIYFSVFSIGSIPLIYKNITNKSLRTGLMTLYILILLFDYYLFFHSPIWVDKYTHFYTIFPHIF